MKLKVQSLSKVLQILQNIEKNQSNIKKKIDYLESVIEKQNKKDQLLNIQQDLAYIKMHMALSEDRERDLILLCKNQWPFKPNKGVRCITKHSIAHESNDYKYPRGTKNDNTRHPRLVKACENIFSGKIKYLDLGCAGGGLVWDFLMQGHEAYGIEGSDYSLKEKRAEWKMISSNLFTADITKEYVIIDSSKKKILFNVITAFEVLEHIHENNIFSFFKNIQNNLHDNGIFIASIATFQDSNGIVNFHQTIQPKKWWINQLKKIGFVEQKELLKTADFARGSGNLRAHDWNATLEPKLGFHLVLKKIK